MAISRPYTMAGQSDVEQARPARPEPVQAPYEMPAAYLPNSSGGGSDMEYEESDYEPEKETMTDATTPNYVEVVEDVPEVAVSEKESWMKKMPSKKTLIIIGIALTLALLSLRFYKIYKSN